MRFKRLMKFEFAIKKEKSIKYHPIYSLLTIIISIIIFYFLTFPAGSGSIGQWIKGFLTKMFGMCAFILPFLSSFVAIKIGKTKTKPKFYILFIICFFVLLCGIFSFVGKILFDTNYGGLTGKFIFTRFANMFGVYPGFLLLLCLFFYSSFLVLEKSFTEFISRIYEKLKEDIEIWHRTIKEEKKLLQQKQQISIPSIAESVSSTSSVEVSTPSPTPISKSKNQEETTAEEITTKETPDVKKPHKPALYELPPIDLLSPEMHLEKEMEYEEMMSQGAYLEETLSRFGVDVKVVDVTRGPTVMKFELKLSSGVKLHSLTSLSNEIALAMKVANVRFTGPIPGKGTVGIEIPTPESRFVTLREVLSCEEFKKSKSLLSIALGKTTDGEPIVADISPMPHLLIAGATGTGKSICIHSIIMSILYKAAPDEVKLLLIDPKRLELPMYSGIPHLYNPCVLPEEADVVTLPAEAARSLKALVNVMEKRYEEFARVMVRNIDSYNELMMKEKKKKLYYVVVIIDEFADLMLTMPKEIEDSIQRLAQMARAVGIHLILATQRPSVDVITGVIKANFSSRIAFQVLSKVDSRVILDMTGAENLMGKGDMLFLPTGATKPIRVQGSYVSEKEVQLVVDYIKSQNISPQYDEYEEKIITKPKEDEKQKENIKKALKLILERRRVSQDLLKAHFGSSAKATDILSLLEIQGYIFKPEGTNKWHINYEKINKYLESEKEDTKDKS